ncbi:probable aminopeptidase NPEPL1 isoform X1 [Thrips palmi]|uniref:Probable aminopeptidase NPEPL1 isoform X1 n=1 Tax=Thrips palmi TaxID=161013 RepID=A0A6P8YTS1_THRPL|nr:probable aminopeptidase NPEPL1 isoform X1 [Thrips palmi]XP_034243446.1 probable aminopeptidase NPEPL1 isoform X1 [Thrips palmi]XP_034243447.1 probable aminopeptidase NPEPL1 isoform X1 [Thrips palmi]XP_034243448.1 probable aminopeptidase NPEPL1 isoform X1 [Thrips palmi]
MSKVKITFSNKLTESDPLVNPVIIIGKLENLKQVSFNVIKAKLDPRVSEEVYQSALTCMQPSPTDVCSLYLNMATLAALPRRCARHNAPSHANFITKLVRSTCLGVDEYVVIVCERQDVLASACAVARAYPIYSRKTLKPTSTPNGTAGAACTATSATVRVEFILVDGGKGENVQPLSDGDLLSLEEICASVRTVARIVDTPCSEMNVKDFTNEIEQVAAELGVACTVIVGEELQEKGFGGIYGVGKAAIVPPALVTLSYTPPNATQTIAWVGKGIVYDTGGLSIKGKTAMPGMKRDCGGAAAVLGAFRAAVKLGFSENLHAVFCLAENAVGPNATRPDDILTLYSGRTVEINNTDAEGRVVLADGVSYAQKDLKANIILDMATLTGAQAIATGRYHAAVLTNREEWEEYCLQAGRTSGDLTFPIPFCPELHLPEFSSAFADMKNAVADRGNAQSSCAGLFIFAQLGVDFPGAWIHVDMASPCHCGERATGYGVALLVTLFGNYSSQPLLQNMSSLAFDEVFDKFETCKKFKRN